MRIRCLVWQVTSSPAAVLAVSGFAVLAGLPACNGQQPARLEFEAASIKPHPPSDGSLHVSIAGGHGRISYTNVTVRALIRKAYGLRVYPPSVGGSDPLSTDRYDIVAKAPADASDEQTMQMFRALLEGRFGLVVHRETKELPVYALVTGKNGHRLHEAKG